MASGCCTLWPWYTLAKVATGASLAAVAHHLPPTRFKPCTIPLYVTSSDEHGDLEHSIGPLNIRCRWNGLLESALDTRQVYQSEASVEALLVAKRSIDHHAGSPRAYLAPSK